MFVLKLCGIQTLYIFHEILIIKKLISFLKMKIILVKKNIFDQVKYSYYRFVFVYQKYLKSTFNTCFRLHNNHCELSK